MPVEVVVHWLVPLAAFKVPLVMERFVPRARGTTAPVLVPYQSELVTFGSMVELLKVAVELNVCGDVHATEEVEVRKPGLLNPNVNVVPLVARVIRLDVAKVNAGPEMLLMVVVAAPAEVDVTYSFPPASRSDPRTTRLPVVVALPLRRSPPNVGILVVPIFCGKLKLMILGELVATVIWFAVP
jgi:hypothetical protein